MMVSLSAVESSRVRGVDVLFRPVIRKMFHLY